MSADFAAAVAARAHRATDNLHSLIYFCPEADEEYRAIGLRPGSMPYFASRSAAMGAVTPGVTAATFFNFNPTMVAKHIPRAWTLASPEDILAARLRGADRALRRLLGEAVASPEVGELLELARDATTALGPQGRPLYAAHATLEWPEEPHLALWHAATLLREYRGDGHLAALSIAGLSGIEALITHCATGRGFTVESAKLLRGWSDEQWDAGVESLRGRGLMDDDGLTADGVALRAQIEQDTDRIDVAAWNHLGQERTARLLELGKGLTQIVVANGAFPASVFAAAK
ncbi:MAG: hypothetical protein ABI429_03175 [Jatrophihabitantaceae bacterium]